MRGPHRWAPSTQDTRSSADEDIMVITYARNPPGTRCGPEAGGHGGVPCSAPSHRADQRPRRGLSPRRRDHSLGVSSVKGRLIEAVPSLTGAPQEPEDRPVGRLCSLIRGPSARVEE